MYDKKDPRAVLAKSKGNLENDITDVKVVEMYKVEANETSENAKTWWSRGQNFFLAYSEVKSESTFTRNNQVDEYVVLLPNRETKATVKWEEKEVEVNGYSFVVVPKGKSDITVSSGIMVRLFSVLNEDLLDLPINKADYAEPDLNVAPFEAWPESPKGSDIRVYSLDVPKEEGRFGRIFRCSTFMVNFLYLMEGPRDPRKLSPHSHDDFEQCSLVLKGKFVHHLRWPWKPDRLKWKEDQHIEVGSPSVTVIPPGVIHTSEAIGEGTNKLVDIFCPPRLDFSKQAGWVLNDEDYPIE